MSFYLDDDDDDGYLPSSQSGRPSGASFLSPSQGSTTDRIPQSQSQQSTFSAAHNSQGNEHLTDIPPSHHHQHDYDAPTVDFVCRNCGSRDAYLDETTNDIICNVCFTQSQTHVDSSQQQFDYDDAFNMAHKGRDGRIQPTKTKAPQTKTIGSRAKPLSDYDNTRKQPSLAECLQGFQTILQASCKIVCRDLLPLPNIRKNVENTGGDNSDHTDDEYTAQKIQKRQATKRVLNTVRNLWKAYLWSWHEGAEYYGNLYPQVRFSFRDCFLQSHIKGMLYQTLAARAAKELKKKIDQEPDDDDVENDDQSTAILSGHYKGNERHSDDDTNTRDSIASTDQKAPVNTVVPSTAMKLSRKRSRHDDDAKRWKGGRTETGCDSEQNDSDNDTAFQNEGDDDDSGVSSNADSNDDMNSVISDISTGAVGNSKAAVGKGDSQIKSHSLARLIYFHTKKKARDSATQNTSKKQEGNRKRAWNHQPKLGRKEAALVLQPSLVMVMGMILIATAPYGISESDVLHWVQQGSLPLLNAFDCLLSPSQQEALSLVAPFFRCHKLPTIAALKRSVLGLHVACGYKPPPVPLSKGGKKQGQLSDKSLMAPGRIIRPSNVPLVLANLVSNLGLSQLVLDFALALMGLPVSRSVSSANESVNDESSWLPPTLSKAHPDGLNDVSRILAVVVVACKLIPNWYSGLEYSVGSSVISADAKDRTRNSTSSKGWIPWDREHFNRIGNGKTEMDYLNFLEATVMHSDKYVYPEFVKMLDDTDPTHIEDAVADPPVCANNVLLRTEPRSKTQKHPNNTAGKNSKPETKRKNKTPQFLYRLTKREDMEMATNIQDPLRPLIEYFAYRTWTSFEKIVGYLIVLDEEMGNCCDSAVRAITLSPEEAYNLIISSNEDKKAII
ncbi:hypothetical protein IV203_015639 [Nitzschia inconspicua]|uniref:Uncharacterized protein n=1 Tax=Nitzschia inconspicua TaxID=303405 RepID=A0A9K3PTB9_9STRA|nr:hypothetical protein IV203_015639 [Nitzschia inconspicua]